MGRRIGVVVTLVAVLAAGCALVRPTGPGAYVDGYADQRWFRHRQDDYLRFATTQLVPDSPLNVIAHAERARRDRRYSWDASAVTVAALQPQLDRIDAMEDTTDFTMLYLLNLWYGYRDVLSAEVRAAIEQRVIAFKYWWTEPTPPGIIDDKIYWTENHRLIFNTIEYLAGQAFPTTVFTNDGRTGAEHRDDAAARIDEWIDEKVRFGFSEWHSDVYYQKDITPLLTIVEWANDRALANRAAMLLDVVLFDLALHLQEGNNGATHGRSYMKDKSKAADQDVFHLAKLLFEDTDQPYRSTGEAGAVLFARAKRYRLPEVLRRVALNPRPGVDRERMGVPLDPSAPVEPDPVAPYGLDFDDPENLEFWWERGAQTTWQVLPLTIATADAYGLWDTMQFKPFKPLRDVFGDNIVGAQLFAQQLAPALAFALSSEVNTYTYRSDDVMLSTAQSYRPGVYGDQYHIQQATLDEDAVVFTTNPKYEPQIGTQWPDSDGYWTGEGSTPRAVQHNTVGIAIYAPQYTPFSGPPLDTFRYLPATHAYFPQERFDEVVQANGWTFGRRGDGYVAIWSYRPAAFRAPAPGEYTNGLTQPFDLRADGGADNVWITEVGDRKQFGSFAAFRAAVLAAPVEVTDRGDAPTGLPLGFDVRYDSPSQGEIAFGWTGPLTVGGQEVAIDGYPRYDNPFTQVPFEGRRMVIRDGGWSLELDFDLDRRRAGSPIRR